MPSGQTHDRITLWSLPFVTGITYRQTQSSDLTLIVAGAFLFSGLMFGPDLDLPSIQYKRWGLLRWIWRPYQKLIRHRSLLSHGIIIGNSLRLIYLASWLGVVGIFALGVAQLLGVAGNRQLLVQLVTASINQYATEWMALYLGLELGAVSHSLSDWIGSAAKRYRKQAKSGSPPPGKISKNKPRMMNRRR